MEPDKNYTEIIRRLDIAERTLREHYHNGIEGGEIQLERIQGLFRTISTNAGVVTQRATKPRRVIDQIFIDTTTPKKLHIYDMIGANWYSTALG